jgi:ATP-dependent DNA helicase DinG
MAKNVSHCLSNKTNLLIEAGTGVGKSFAYLIPAILSCRKTVVSTASIALQDQLAEKDLIFLQKTITKKFSFGVLKGKNNYVCIKREREFSQTSAAYLKFLEWLKKTKTGEKNELPFVPEFWSNICGNSQDCNGRKCPFYHDCFYYRYFRYLYNTDILIVNHHLLAYDLLLEFNILPFHDQLVVDEASEVEAAIAHVMGSVLSYDRFAWLLYRLKGLKIMVDPLFPSIEQFFNKNNGSIYPTTPIPSAITEGLYELKKMLDLSNIISTIKGFIKTSGSDEYHDRVETTIHYIEILEADVDDFIEQDDSEKVFYMSINDGMLELKSELVESRKQFERLASEYESIIMTSATLTSNNSFAFFKDRLGIENFEEKIIGSPFDYKNHALLYINKDLPVPNREHTDIFEEESLTVIQDLISASCGRALILFTSYRHLHFISENIESIYPIKAQGDMPAARLIEWFKETPSSVLLATSTFWQGIDVKGEDLSLVVIVRLPFSSPEDPVYSERCKRLKGRWFTDLALPRAILLLRQGFGRLIRGRNEYGVVAILDTRVINHSYGRSIIYSLPDMNIVYDLEDVNSFFKNISLKKNM